MDFLLQQTFLLLAIGIAVSAGALVASIRERKTELATLRAIGYRRAQVAFLIMAEAEVIAVAGALLAVLPLYLGFREHGLSLGPGLLSSVTVSIDAALVALTGAAALGLVAGVYPMMAYGWNISSRDLLES